MRISPQIWLSPPIKAKVESQDGPAGDSLALIVNPITRQVKYIVVRDKKAIRSLPTVSLKRHYN
jgi:hypothetical protein